MRTQLVLWTLRRRPWRNLLISFSVAITVAVMIVFFSARFEIKKFLDRVDDIPFQRLFVKPHNLANLFESYPLSLHDDLARVPGVEKVVYVQWVMAKTADGRMILALGAPPDQLEVERDFFPVDDDVIDRWKKDRIGVVLADGLADLLHVKPGDLGEITTKLGPLKFRVAGISRGGVFQMRIAFHYDYVNEFYGGKGIVNDYRLILDRKTDAKPIVKAVDEILASKGFGSHLVNESTIMQLSGLNTASMIPNLLGALGLVLLLTTGLAIANATVISVRERRAELATLRVLGFKKRVVASLIVSESLVVCALGGVLGVAIAWLVTRSGVSLGSAMMLQSLKITPEGLWAGLATSLLVPVVGSTLSAWLAVRAPLAEALRDAG